MQEWRRQRTAVSKHLLKQEAVAVFCQPINTVADDFVQRLQQIRDSQGEVQDLELELFKWAMECKSCPTALTLLSVHGSLVLYRGSALGGRRKR